MSTSKSKTGARATPQAQRKLLEILGVDSIEEAVRAVQGRARARRRPLTVNVERRPLTVNVERTDFTDPLRMLRAAELAALLGVHPVTIHKWTRTGRLPQPVKLGHVTAWRARDIAAWLDRQQSVTAP